VSRKPKATGVEARVIRSLADWQDLVSRGLADDLQPAAVIRRMADEIAQRQQMGRKKYGTTLAQNQARFVERVRHAAEESWDGLAYMQWVADDWENASQAKTPGQPPALSWIGLEVANLLTMQRLLACLLTRLLMAAEAAELDFCLAVAGRIPFVETAHLSGRDCITKWGNDRLGIHRQRITYGCPKADRAGHWQPHPKKEPAVLYYVGSEPTVHSTLVQLLLARPALLTMAEKLYPAKGGRNA
jgi:hypothetical protein